MSRHEPSGSSVSQRLIVIGSAVVAMAIVLLAIQHTAARRTTVMAYAPDAIEPRADDGLLNWNAFDPAVERARYYPVARIPAASR